MLVTGDYCAKVCRVLQLCSSLTITVPSGVTWRDVVAVTGTQGEGLLMTLAERKRVVEAWVKAAKGK